jgi:7-cyano-7-deazaguanine reductase
MSEILLGKDVKYKDFYDNSLLFPITRSSNRNKIITQSELPFNGYDLWNCYELSWLNLKGKPEVRILHFVISANSEYLIESKSIKLYLNSFNNTKFTNEIQVLDLITKDLSSVSGLSVEVSMHPLDYYQKQPLSLFEGTLLDEIDLEIFDYEVNSDLLEIDFNSTDNVIEETLYSNLLKSNCLVTNQPDWASVQIKYKGRKINHASLLKYLISYRNHNGFHEDCIEHIFIDILENCKPQELTIYAKYTRRGGVDINPFRTNLNLQNTEIIKIRDIRQ